MRFFFRIKVLNDKMCIFFNLHLRITTLKRISLRHAQCLAQKAQHFKPATDLKCLFLLYHYKKLQLRQQGSGNLFTQMAEIHSY